MTTTAQTKQGRCLCAERWCAHCHCDSCRRNTSSPFTTFFGVPKDAYQFTGKQPSVYRSSPGVRRLFCANCGTPVAYESDRYPREIHFYAASLEQPNDIAPQFHVHCEEKLSWVILGDDLPRYDREKRKQKEKTKKT